MDAIPGPVLVRVTGKLGLEALEVTAASDTGHEGQAELALAGGRDGRDQEPDRRELAAQMREAWDAHQGRDEVQETAAPEPERETSQAFAARLREAAAGVDREALADRAAALREGREAEEQHTAQEQERQRTKELEQEQEREVHARRDRGHDYGL